MRVIVYSVVMITAFLITAVKQLTAQWSLQRASTNQELRDIYFADSANGWVAGLGGIFHTTNAGEDWVLQDSTPTRSISGISRENCWGIGGLLLLHTTNGGNSWSQRSISSFFDSIPSTRQIIFVDSLTGWITSTYNTGNNNWILRTTDGGNNWLSTKLPLYALFCSFIDRNKGWIGGNFEGFSTIYKSVNGGASWDSIGSLYGSYGTNFTNINFIDEHFGWITVSDARNGCGCVSAVWRTADGGKSWSGPCLEGAGISKISFIDTLNGWTVNYDCNCRLIISRTENGGSLWTIIWQDSGSCYVSPVLFPQKIYFLNQNVGWIVGDSGKILHTTSGGITNVEQETAIPLSFDLFQNYPNPFNPSTTIYYDLPEATFVNMVVYDILGRKVRTLLSGIQQAGGHHVVFDAQDLTNGMYMYRIQAGKFSTMHKMLLLR